MINKTPEVSVLLPAYKESLSWFSTALKSITEQTFQNIEIFVIIDNPADRALTEHSQSISSKDPRVKVIKNATNMGLTASLNNVIPQTSGKYICRMDADDISLTNRIETQLEYIKKTEYDLIGGQVEVINSKGEFLYFVNSLPQTSKKVSTALKWNNCVFHPTWFGKREVFLSFYRNVPLCEDYDFLLRASLNGYLIGNVPEVVLKYRMSPESISRSNLYKQYLAQCYLTKEFSAKKTADLVKLNNYIEHKHTKKRAAKYTKSNTLFTLALQEYRRKKYLRSFMQVIQSLAGSRSYTNKLRRMFFSFIL